MFVFVCLCLFMFDYVCLCVCLFVYVCVCVSVCVGASVSVRVWNKIYLMPLDWPLTFSELRIGFLNSLDEGGVFRVFCLLIGHLEDAIRLSRDGRSAVDHSQRVSLADGSLGLG